MIYESCSLTVKVQNTEDCMEGMMRQSKVALTKPDEKKIISFFFLLLFLSLNILGPFDCIASILSQNFIKKSLQKRV